MRLIVLCMFITCPFALLAQDTGGWDERMDDDDASDDALRSRIEELEYLRTHPVNVFHPAYGELLRIPYLSPMLAESIMLFTDTVEVTDVSQLQNAALMTPQVMERITPFITADRPDASTSWSVVPERIEFRSRFEQRREQTLGFSEGKYSGSPLSSVQRLRLENDHWEFAAVMEKDAGERWQDGFRSRSVQFRDAGIVRDIILGNFSAGASQGLVFARSISASKGSDAVGQIRQRGSFLSPSVSTDEFRSFDGAALRLASSSLSVTALTSSRSLPATKDSDATVTSFYMSGLFRTAGEERKRNVVHERMHGLIIDVISDKRPALTLSAMSVRYSENISEELLTVREARRLTMASIGWDLPAGALRVFGEAAASDLYRFSIATGTMFSFSKDLMIGWHHRSYPRGPASPFARPFSERSSIGDGERGEYFGMEYRSGPLTAAAYVDQSILPSDAEGFDGTRRSILAEVTYGIARGTEAAFRYRISRSMTLDDMQRDEYRFGISYPLTTALSIAQRLTLVTVTGPRPAREHGMMSYIDADYQPRSSPFRIRSRMVWFRSPSYASRTYQYEPDVPGNLSNPPLYGTGIRWFVVASYEPFDRCRISMKYSEMKRYFVTSLGSGEDAITGNIDGRWAFQIDFRL